MKRKKNKSTPIISGVLATSIIGASCSGYFNDNIYEQQIPESDLGHAAIPISLKLKASDAKYINALQQLSMDIFENPEIAQKVYSNPETVLESYGYSGAIKLDDSLIKIVLALGNPEINAAIKEKDMSKFIKLCRKYGFISSYSNSELFKDDYYQAQLVKLKGQTLYQLSTRSNDEHALADKDELFAIAGAVVLAVVAAAIVAGVGVVWNVGVVYNNYVVVNSATLYKKAEISVFDIVPVQPEPTKDYQLIDELNSEIIDAAVEYVKIEHPDYFNVNSEDEFRKLMYDNILSNLE